MANFMNAYTLEKTESGSKEQYYVSFIDGNAVLHRIEINFDIYSTLFELNKIDRNLTRSDERNLENLDLTEEGLSNRSLIKQKKVEDIVLEKEMKAELWNAIGELPDIQRKRLLLYYDYGFTLKEIALLEGCSIRAVKYSIDNAKKKLGEKIKNL